MKMHRMAGTSENVRSRHVLSWFGHVERMSDERMAKKILGKIDRGRPGLNFENTVSMILEEGRVKSMKTPWRA